MIFKLIIWINICIGLIFFACLVQAEEREDTRALATLPNEISGFVGKEVRVFDDVFQGSYRAYWKDDILISVYVYPRIGKNVRRDSASELKRAQEMLLAAKDQGYYKSVRSLIPPRKLSLGLDRLPGVFSFHKTVIKSETQSLSAEVRSIIYVSANRALYIKMRTSYKKIERKDFSEIVEFHKIVINKIRTSTYLAN